MTNQGPQFPFYIPTKGRPHQQLTAKLLLDLGITPTLVVQQSELDQYQAANPQCQVISWPQEYLDNYEKTPELDPHPTTGAAHNYMWTHAREAGYSHHWTMDDNLKGFHYRTPQGKLGHPTPLQFKWHEDLALRFQNLAGFSLALSHCFGGSPMVLNTRLYCATLFRNDLDKWGIQWRRGLNDDTIVSLDILKTRHLCTAESRMLITYKTGTSRARRLEGGMTDFYAQGGFIRKAAEAIRIHPDCVQMVTRYGRVHHRIDYSQFTQQLIPTS